MVCLAPEFGLAKLVDLRMMCLASQIRRALWGNRTTAPVVEADLEVSNRGMSQVVVGTAPGIWLG